MLVGEALYLRAGVAQLPQAVAARAKRPEVLFGGRLGAGDAVFDLPQLGPGLLERFEAYFDAVLGADLLLAELAPAVQPGYGPLQLSGGLLRGGG